MPEVLESLAPHITRDHLVVSVAAGITLATLERALGEGARVVRVMPNTPSLGEAAGAPGLCVWGGRGPGSVCVCVCVMGVGGWGWGVRGGKWDGGHLRPVLPGQP